MFKVLVGLTLCSALAFPSVAAERTPEAEAVFENLKRIPQEGKFVYSWCHPWREDSPAAAELKGGFSDELGRHPVLYFTDFYFVTDATKSAEKIRTSRACLLAMVKKAWTVYRAVPVFSWHPENPYVLQAKDGWHKKNAPFRYRHAIKGYPQEHRYVVHEILTEKGFARDWYDTRLVEIVDFLSALKDAQGVAIPAVVRLFHECEDDWQWWGSGSVSAEDYKALFRMTVTDLRKRTGGGKNLLFAYSPDRYWHSAVDPTKPTDFLYRYPGDDVVDILGFDDYSIGEGKNEEEIKKIFDNAVRHMRMVAACAREKGKATGLFETGVLGPTGKKTKRDDTYDLLFRAMTSPGATLGFINTWGGGYTRPESDAGRACWKRFTQHAETLTYESGFDLVCGFREPAEKTASDSETEGTHP